LSLPHATRFASIAWTTFTGADSAESEHVKYPQGILAAGMMDGTVLLIDPERVLSDAAHAILATLPASGPGPIPALQFSPLSTHLLCTGTYQGRVTVWDATDPTHPQVQNEFTAATEITSVAWNTAVPHICATAAADGLVTVWDIQSNSAWCEIRAAGKVADLRWNPKEGLHLLTASGDDRNPVLHIWDLGTSTTVPLGTLSGHAAGILATAWCPHDDSLLLTVAKDHHTYLWDMLTLQAVAELPMAAAVDPAPSAASHSANALFASGRPGLQEQKQMRYYIQWSPLQRGLALTCSLDKKIQVHNLLSLCTATGRPPAWMARRSSISTAFGGLVISCRADAPGLVTVQTIPEQPALVEAAAALETAQQYEALPDVCASLAVRTNDEVYGFLPALWEAPPRPLLLRQLGLDPEEIAAAAQQYAAQLEEKGDVANHDETSLGTNLKTSMAPAAQTLVQKALLVGNFAAAVDCCLATENYADALLLAACGGGDLWATTQERYLDRQSAQRPYLALVSGIVRHPLEEWVTQSDAAAWRETLAMVSTYASTTEEFAHLCAVLGERLLAAGEDAAASLCFMCAMSLERTVPYWKQQLEQQQVTADFTLTADLLALHDFVSKVSVFARAIGSFAGLTPEVESLFTTYAEALAQQGLLVTAAKFCHGSSMEAKVLRDRLYRSRSSQGCYSVLGVAPEFPYVMVDVQQSRGLVFVQPQEITKEPEILSNGHSDQTQQPVTEQFQAQGHQPFAVGAQSSSDTLAPGWIALQDPTSGNMYYANETTGETTWEKPLAPVHAPYSAPQLSSFPQETGLDASQRSQMTQPTSAAQSRPKASIVSKYGDGFVSSASNPELAHQYGNVGTSNPYGGTARPGPAAVQPISKAPVSGSLNLDTLQLSNHHKSIKDTLLGCAEALKQTALNVVEKKQLDEAEKGVAILVKKLNRDEISDAMVDQVFALVNAISQHDFAGALTYQTTMANSEWRDHKDWLKGIKILIQLASKKF
jgi:protein transport protein SEC31